MKVTAQTILLRMTLLGVMFIYFTFPIYGMLLEDEGNKVRKSTFYQTKPSKNTIAPLSSIERKLKGMNQKEHMESELRKVARSLDLLPFDQNPQKNHIIALWEETAKQGNFVGLYNMGGSTQLDKNENAAENIIKKSKTIWGGICLTPNEAEAFYWHHKAHTSQDPEAWFVLGYLLLSSAARNVSGAMKWFCKSADQNNPWAQWGIGLIYNEGQGVKRDVVEAMKWFRKSANQNNPWGQVSVGVLYSLGAGVELDYIEAIKWLNKAADQNHVWGQLNLGMSYIIGRGVKQDFVEAIKWYLKAAEQNYPQAQVMLGLCYMYGKVVQQDYVEALKWYLKAANQNNAEAQWLLGLLYTEGKEVQRDYIEALKWYLKATEQNHKGAYHACTVFYLMNYGEKKDHQKFLEKFTKLSFQQKRRMIYDSILDIGCTDAVVPRIKSLLSHAKEFDSLTVGCTSHMTYVVLN